MNTAKINIKDKWAIPTQLSKQFTNDEISDLKEQFELVDHDGEGSIDASELQSMMASLDVHVSTASLQKLIEEVDDNHSGALEFYEFVQLVNNMKNGSNSMLGQFIQNSKHASLIRAHLQDLKTNPIPNVTIKNTERIRDWIVLLHGPKDTPYENGTFQLEIRFGKSYPYHCPDITMVTRMYHLNFTMLLNGRMSLESIQGCWQEGWTIRTLLECIIKLLKSPDINIVPPKLLEASQSRKLSVKQFAANVAKLYVENREAYCSNAKQFTVSFAL